MPSDEHETKGLLSQAPVRPQKPKPPLIPVVLLVFLSTLLYSCYFFFHLVWVLDTKDKHTLAKVYAEAAAVHFFFFMTVVCLLVASLSSPGTIPRTEPWDPVADGHGDPECVEVKPDGKLRFCTTCGLYKPDRSHHDSKTNQCVLEMDHYCPWIHNVIGFSNRKAFLLLLMYASGALISTTVFMIPTLGRAMSGEYPIAVAFVCSFAIFTAAGLGLVLTAFFFFHCWLVGNNYTTIEYFEKRNSGKSEALRNRYKLSVFDQGFVANVLHVFGYNPLFWFIPTNSGRTATGVKYELAEDHILTQQMRRRLAGEDDAAEP